MQVKDLYNEWWEDMSNPQKEKGSRWERESAKLLNRQFPNTWKRIIMSGALGTMMDIPMLRPDIIGSYAHLPKKIVGECKVGYGGKSMTIQKDWFDHIVEIADENYAWPVVVLKFEKSRSGVKHVMCFDFDTWDLLMREVADLHHELLKAYEEIERLSNEE